VAIQSLSLWRLSLEVVPGDMWVGCYWCWKTGVYGDPGPMSRERPRGPFWFWSFV